jgi:F-type H+-transporting ATPase subunit epsilon
MSATLELRVVTPEKPVFEGRVESVTVPAHDGEVGILPRHARFLASLGVGELRAKTAGGVVKFFIEGGFVQVAGERVTVLCDRALGMADLDVAAAEAAVQAAAQAPVAERVRLQQRAAAMRRVTGAAGKGH